MYQRSSISKLSLSQFFQLSFNVKLARFLPLVCLHLYLYLLGLFYFSLKRTERVKIIHCLKYVLKSNHNVLKFYLSSFKTFLGIFDHYYEKLILVYRPLSEMMDFLRLRLKITNKSCLDNIASTGKGGILVTGHFGAVEFLPLALAMTGYKIAIICRFKTKKQKDEVLRKAGKFDAVFIDADEPKVTFRALRAIKNGRILVTECDEFPEWRPHKDKKIPVFGQMRSQDRTLDFFYRKTGVPVVMGLMMREKKGFTLCLDTIADGRKDISPAAMAWEKLEGYIKKYPQQWYQWKEAANTLFGHTTLDYGNADQKIPLIRDEHPIYSPGLS